MFSFKPRKSEQDLQQFLMRLGNQATSGRTRYAEDRRNESRTHINLGVRIFPLNEGVPDADASFTAVTRDVSSVGLGIMTQQTIEAEAVLVRLPSDPAPRLLRAEVRDSRDLGCGWLLYSLKAIELLDPKAHRELLHDESFAEV